LFNNAIIFVLLFGKTAKLLLSSMIWVEETNDSLILVKYLRKDEMQCYMTME